MQRNILLFLAGAAGTSAVEEAVPSSGDDAFTVERFRSCRGGTDRLVELNSKPVAAIVLDMFLEDSQGSVTFETVFRAAPHVPILILCREQDEQIARQAVRCGAQDYLLHTRLNDYSLPKLLDSMLARTTFTANLVVENERARVTLNSIGDAVISTDVAGNVTYLNSVAEQLTGWSRAEAQGLPVEGILRIVDGSTREPIQSPLALAILQDKTVSLGANCVLIHRNGLVSAIEDTAAPIHDLRGQITGAVIVFHDVSAARAMSLKMSHLAHHDFLTDLPNRMLLQDRLTQAIASASRSQKSLALLFLDVDHFKRVNDTLGHGIGDRLLQSIASRLVSCVRGSDTVSRQGGDEFVVLLTEVTTDSDVHSSVDKILAALGAPHCIADQNLSASVSLGVSVYPEDGTNAEALLGKADAALLRAKSRRPRLLA